MSADEIRTSESRRYAHHTGRRRRHRCRTGQQACQKGTSHPFGEPESKPLRAQTKSWTAISPTWIKPSKRSGSQVAYLLVGRRTLRVGRSCGSQHEKRDEGAARHARGFFDNVYMYGKVVVRDGKTWSILEQEGSDPREMRQPVERNHKGHCALIARSAIYGSACGPASQPLVFDKFAEGTKASCG